MASKGLYANINARKKAGTSRPKSESTVSSKAYKNMQAGFPKKMKEGGMLKSSRKARERALEENINGVSISKKYLKAVPEDKKKSLGKLPTPVRKKMGFMKEGGMVIVDRNYLKGK